MTIASGRVALVTGAASGIGLGVSERLIREGVSVVLSDIDEPGLRAAEGRLGPRARVAVADVRSESQLGAAVASAIEAFGRLDTLVLAAGVVSYGGLETTSDDDWDRVVDITLKGSFLAAKQASPHLRASGRGRIVAISSESGRKGFAGGQAYAAAKFGVNGLIESIAAELAEWGVTANAVCPVGLPETAMGQAILAFQVQGTGRTPEDLLAARANGLPLGRNATLQDVVDAVLFFISDESSFLTGLSLDVNGGNHLGRDPMLAWRL